MTYKKIYKLVWCRLDFYCRRYIPDWKQYEFSSNAMEGLEAYLRTWLCTAQLTFQEGLPSHSHFLLLL